MFYKTSMIESFARNN